MIEKLLAHLSPPRSLPWSDRHPSRSPKHSFEHCWSDMSSSWRRDCREKRKMCQLEEPEDRLGWRQEVQHLAEPALRWLSPWQLVRCLKRSATVEIDEFEKSYAELAAAGVTVCYGWWYPVASSVCLWAIMPPIPPPIMTARITTTARTNKSQQGMTPQHTLNLLLLFSRTLSLKLPPSSFRRTARAVVEFNCVELSPKGFVETWLSLESFG